jgi:hypothetical protein
MDYQIIRAAPEIGQIEVLYKDGNQPVGAYAIDVPVVDGAFLTGDALHNEIMHRAPTWVSQRAQEVASATGFSQIVALVQPLPVDEQTAEQTSEQQANAAMWAQVEYEKKLAKALVKFGVLSSDPTEIPVTGL